MQTKIRGFAGLAARSWPGAFALMLGALVIGSLSGERPAYAIGQTPDASARFRSTLGSSDNTKWSYKTNQYQSWLATKGSAINTRYGGSGFRDYLESDPKLVILFAGYPFSLEFNQARGHANAVEDVKGTKRRNDKTPATCWSCKSPDVPRLMVRDTVSAFYAGKFDHYDSEVKNSIGCADCHNPKTFALQISRPALIEAFERQGKDIAKATKAEMKTLVCAQCHVEYYFKGTGKYLTFPWDDGVKPDSFEKYYAGNGHSDWTHPISGAKMVKMQHPDYELYQESVHAYAGVSCADCHMPRVSNGKAEYTTHQVRSPLYNIDKVCANCHGWTEKQIKDRVYAIQDKNRELLDRAETALVSAHLEIGDAIKLGAKDSELDEARKTVSKAQMYWDYIAASNGMGFHAPQEAARILAKAVDLAQESRLQASRIRSRYGANTPLAWPTEFSAKTTAQAYIKPFVEAQKAKEAAAAAAKPPR